MSTAVGSINIGDYTILNEIARGGMGIVYKALDRRLNRTVALKLIKSGELADRAQIERFYIEARAAAHLDHRGIVQVFEVGQHAGQHFMAMAFVDGQSLWQQVKEKPVAPKHAAMLMQQVAEAIQYAHDRGIVHRDLKPQNILLTMDGQPKVTDFGLAKAELANSSLTMSGEVLGTPSYMPPEQAKGNVKQIGPLTDVYSLGATLYCLLTGRPPFQAATHLETMQQVVGQEPVSPRSLNRGVPVDLETISLRCLEKVPASRYESAGALAQDLQRYLVGEPIHARRAGNFERTLKWIARKPIVAVAYGLSVLTLSLLAIGITIYSFYRSAESARAEAVTSRNEALSSKTEADAARIEAVGAKHQTELALRGEQQARAGEVAARNELEQTKAYNEYLLNIRLVPALWQDGAILNARRSLDLCPERLRAWEWRYLNRLIHPELMTIGGHPRRISSIRLSRDGTRLVSASGMEVRLWDTSDGKLLHLFVGKNHLNRPVCFSADGGRLLVADDDLIVLDGRDFGELQRIPHQGVVSLDCAADGSKVAAVDGTGALRIWKEGNELQELFPPETRAGGLSTVTFTPDSPRIVGVSHDGKVSIVDPESGRPTAQFGGHSAPLTDLAVSPDNRFLATAGDDGMVKVWNLNERAEVYRIEVSPPGVRLWNLVAFDSSGLRLLVSVEGDSAPRVFDAITGKLLTTLKGHGSWCRALTSCPDGRRVATSSEDGTIRLWETANGATLAVLRGHSANVDHLAFSPDGMRLYSGSGDETVKVWDAVMTESDPFVPVTEFEYHAERFPVSFSPNGDWVAWLGNSQTVNVADATTGEISWSERVAPEGVVDFAFSPDGSKVVLAAGEQHTTLHESAGGRMIATLTGSPRAVVKVVYSHDGNSIATASQDGSIYLWSGYTGEKQGVLRGHTQPVIDVRFSPDDLTLGSYGADGTVRLWDMKEHRELFRQASQYIAPIKAIPLLTFSQDGTRLAAPHLRVAKLWELPSGREIRTLEGHKSYTINLGFSPDSKWLASSGWVHEAKIYDAVTGDPIRKLEGHGNDIYCLCFSSDGRRLATGSLDRTVRMWDTSTWQEVACFKGHVGELRAVRFTSDGRRLISAGMDGVRQWIAEESPTERESRRSRFHSAWRKSEVRCAELAQDWDSAAFHLRFLCAAGPENNELRERLRHAESKRNEAVQARRLDPQALKVSD